MTKPLLSIKDLSITFNEKVVNKVSFDVNYGDKIGIVGESGSGKTSIALAILRVLKGAHIDGDIIFKGNSLLLSSQKELYGTRGKEISVIFQEPHFNPIRRIKYQMTDIIKRHFGYGFKESEKKAYEALNDFFLSDVSRIYRSFPHELSGGEKKRVQIAMAFSLKPSLIIADEPTNSLDIISATQVLGMLKKRVEEDKMSLLFITHDLNALKKIATKTLVIYSGTIVEEGQTSEILNKPLHPYTIGLLNSIPKIGVKNITSIPRSIEIGKNNKGCIFLSRCSFRTQKCFLESPKLMKRHERYVRCFLDVT